VFFVRLGWKHISSILQKIIMESTSPPLAATSPIDSVDSSASAPVPLCCHRKDETILEPYEYLSKIPGKDVRGILLDAFQIWLQIPQDKLESIKMIISSLHNARSPCSSRIADILSF
jgi:hypothetical protein